jgi:two-component system, NtrC family, response regulator AtoC
MPSDAPTIGISAGRAMVLGNGDHYLVAAVSTAMRAVERTVNDIAGADIPVLILGESGTGKGAVSYRIHQLSRRQHEPFVKLSCASLTPDYFKMGPGALGNDGKAWPTNGTLFLDEVGELDAACQPKLLCALPDGEAPPGGDSTGVRVIACSARDLEKEMREGRFREDLYYRISGVCLRLPALRQRKEDIPTLVDYFLLKYSALYGRRKPEISAATMRTFLDHSWPGNIRELEHSVQKIITMGDEGAALADLRVGRTTAGPDAGEGLSLKQAARAASREAEREMILKVLSRTRWNRKRAALELRISYKALLYKMKQIGIDSASS